MSQSDDLLSKLVSSGAYRSIKAEQNVVACVRACRWETSQSPFYRDVITGKTREIDAIGFRRWKKQRKNDDISAIAYLFVEVKSAKDSHLLLSGNTNLPKRFESNEYWTNYDEKTLDSIAETLGKSKLDHQSIHTFLHRLEKIAFPKDTMRTAQLRIAPFPVRDCFSAFRETTIGTEKDLDNSVLWRALTALRSVVESRKEQLTQSLLSDLMVGIEYAIRNDHDPIDEGLSSIESRTSRIELFHPIVVIDSNLWSVQEDRPTELSWFRFVQLDYHGHVEWWADVVDYSSFKEFSKIVTNYYEREFKRVRAKPD